MKNKEIVKNIRKIWREELKDCKLWMEFSFKMKEKEEEGGGNEGCRFWFIREDSEYFKMDGEEFIEKELDCKLSEKYNYVCRLDDYWNEVNEKFGVKEDGYDEECDLEEVEKE